jgi:hypothetical protein
MIKLPVLIFIFIVSGLNAATDTLIRHDTVFIDRLIMENPRTNRLIEPSIYKISIEKKACGIFMMAAGFVAGAISIDFLANTSGGIIRKSGYYEITICFSVGLMMAGASMFSK